MLADSLLSVRPFPFVIFFEEGRLGNQLHQYSFLRSAFPNSLIILIGFNDLKAYLGPATRKTNKTVFISTKKVKPFPEWILKLFLTLKIASCLSENSDRCTVNISRCLFIRPLIVIIKGYYQSIAFKSSSLTVSPSENLLNKAYEWLQTNKVANILSCYFIHVRRGDYLNLGTFGMHDSPALPLHWYLSQISYITEMTINPCFILCSDDVTWSKKMFGHLSNVLFAPGDTTLDLVIMENCLGGGILSPSSYSLWASHAIARRNPTAILLAPYFWVGWPVSQWYPPNVEMPWIKYIDVSKTP